MPRIQSPAAMDQRSGSKEPSSGPDRSNQASSPDSPQAAPVPPVPVQFGAEAKPRCSGRQDSILGLKSRTSDPAPTPTVDNLPSHTRFMDYYRRNLAGLMVWLDSQENEYRKRVVPLAENQPAIGFAIMGFAAEHGATAYPHENIATIAESARDKCLHLVQSRAKEMTEKLARGFELNSQSDVDDAEWMLASILIVNNYENVRCRPKVAESHRRAARTIVNLFTHSISAEGRELFAFPPIS